MENQKAKALDWIGSYRNFPQLYSVGSLGFPIGRSTTFPIEDDWSINATGYRGNLRVRQIACDPHVEVLWLDTRGPWNIAVRIRGRAYHTDSETLVKVYDQREDIARSRGEAFGERLHGQAIINTVNCTHITPVRVTLEGLDGPGSVCCWDVDPASLRPAPPPADGSEPREGPIGFRQPWEMTIEEVSAQALAWARRQARAQHLFTVQDGFPTGQSVAVHPHDDWTSDVTVAAGDAAVRAVAANPRVEISWIDASHDAPKSAIPTVVFLRGMATVLDGAAARDTRTIRVRPTRIRTEGFGKGLQLYAWNL